MSFQFVRMLGETTRKVGELDWPDLEAGDARGSEHLATFRKRTLA